MSNGVKFERRSTLDMVTNNGLYVTVVITSVVLIFGYVAYLVLILNSQPQFTVLLPSGEPGALTSEVYMSTQYWVVYFLPVFKGLFVHFLLLSIAWATRSRGCSILFFVLMMAVIVLDGVSFLGIGINAANCNGPDQKNNPCNDHLWCCLNGGGGPEATGCPADPTTFPDGGCQEPIDMRPDIKGNITQDQLKWNNDFKWLFHSGWFFLVVMIAFVMVALTTLCWEPNDPMQLDPMRDTYTTTGGYAVPQGGYPVVASPLDLGGGWNTVRQRNPIAAANTLNLAADKTAGPAGGDPDKLL